jgi:ADP-ribose pyrophosphatase YjhB (NUDIX family)
VIWVGDRLVVARERRRGQPVVTLPGGRVKEREQVIDCLVREVLEETGLQVEVGGLLYVAEVFSPPRVHDVNLIFAASIVDRDVDDDLLLDPVADGAELMPPVAPRLLEDRNAPAQQARWLGNLYVPR